MSPFPYDKIAVSRDITRYIRDRIAGLPDSARDWSADVSTAFTHVTTAAQGQEITAPHLPVEAEVKTLLINVFAGPKTASFGWELYRAYKGRMKLTDCKNCEYPE